MKDFEIYSLREDETKSERNTRLDNLNFTNYIVFLLKFLI